MKTIALPVLVLLASITCRAGTASGQVTGSRLVRATVTVSSSQGVSVHRIFGLGYYHFPVESGSLYYVTIISDNPKVTFSPSGYGFVAEQGDYHGMDFFALF